MTIPAIQQTCWPVDTTACDEFQTYDQAIQDLSTSLAGAAMRMLTGYSAGACPVTVRPCSLACARGSSSWVWTGGTFVPTNFAGTWTNMVCGQCGLSCECGLGQKVLRLPGMIGEVQQVKVDGVVLAPTAYAVQGYNSLVRIDGQLWPTTQAMDKPDTAVGTWSVRYVAGTVVDGTGAFAAGLLACEFAKALTGKQCSLPQGVTQVVRQGISITKTPGVFPDNLTGIRLVDIYVRALNPHRLAEGAAIWSPGSQQTQTWR